MDTCYIKMKNVVSKVFRRYGTFLGRHPLPFIVLPIVVFGGLAAGFVTMDSSSDMEEVYFPTNSRAIKDRQVVRDLFPDLSSVSYNAFSQSDETEAVSLLFQSKNGHNITTLKEVEAMVNQVKAINVTSNGRVVTYNDVCARFASQCVIGGDFVFTSAFQTDLAAGAVTYPLWNGQDLSSSIADVTTDATGHLTSAKILLISFNLLKGSEPWQKEFEMLAGHLSSPLFDVNYETPDSLSEELDKGTDGDIYLFSLTITICCVFALIVTTGGNCVSTRSMLAFGGVLAAGLGIVGAMGLLCLCGVKFVSITGVIPFLIIGK